RRGRSTAGRGARVRGRRALLGHAAWRDRRRALRLRRVLAVLRHEAVAAVRLVLPALLEVLDEVVQSLLLVLRLQQLLDRRRRLRERLLAGRRDLRDVEEVVAELRLDRALELALGRLEDGVVERLLLLALGDREQLAALVLGGLVDRVLLGDRLEALARLQRGERLVGLGLRLGQHDPQVTALGLREARLVLVEVVGDLRLGDGVLALGHL